jgi:hypothetical protein
MKDTCILWEKAKDLGQERGFTLSGTCPIDKSCKGEKCIYIAPLTRITDAIKLRELRQELKQIEETPFEFTRLELGC